MYEKQKKTQNEYIRKHYPYLEPCIKCVYWRRLIDGAKFTKKHTYNNSAISALPACEYNIYNRELKDDDCFIIGDGECKHFCLSTPASESRIKNNIKMNFILNES